MSQNFQSTGGNEQSGRHLTTRRGFITTLSFGVVSLYGLWAAYGAAPTSLRFLTDGMGAGAGGHGMGHGGGGGITPEEFRRMTEAFIEANQLPDGTVKPTRHVMASLAQPSGHGFQDTHEGPAGHGMAATAADPHMGTEERHVADGKHGADRHEDEDKHGAPVSHGMPGMAEDRHGDDGHKDQDQHEAPDRHGMPGMPKDKHGEADGPIEVFMIASRYGYEPDVLRLEANVPYRFRVMAVDAVHGASINFGGGGRMIRCPAQTEVKTDMTFTKPGKLLVYCSVYCGEGHDLMKGAIIVA